MRRSGTLVTCIAKRLTERSPDPRPAAVSLLDPSAHTLWSTIDIMPA